MITSHQLYLLDSKCSLSNYWSLDDLAQIILVRANPCFFALVFNSGAPVILETHRRTEIVNFITSTRVGKGPGPKISIEKNLLLK